MNKWVDMSFKAKGCRGRKGEGEGVYLFCLPHTLNEEKGMGVHEWIITWIDECVELESS
jgi:hypothetical protein